MQFIEITYPFHVVPSIFLAHTQRQMKKPTKSIDRFMLCSVISSRVWNCIEFILTAVSQRFTHMLIGFAALLKMALRLLFFHSIFIESALIIALIVSIASFEIRVFNSTQNASHSRSCVNSAAYASETSLAIRCFPSQVL